MFKFIFGQKLRLKKNLKFKKKKILKKNFYVFKDLNKNNYLTLSIKINKNFNYLKKNWFLLL